jgi:LPXTG-site transpeptidase (sortase) family protein
VVGATALFLFFVVYASVLSGPLTRLVSGRVVAQVAAAPSAGTCVARVQAPRVGLAATVCEGTGTRVVSHVLGHLRGTPMPGQAGEAVVLGHRNAYAGAGSRIARLRVGDAVEVAIGGSSVDFTVVSRRTQSRDSVRFSSEGAPGLTFVTGASAIDPSRVLVVRATSTAPPGVRVTGRDLVARGTARLPGPDGGELLAACGCIVFAGIVFARRRSLDRLASAPWAQGFLTAIAVASMFAAIAFATRALPPTF